MSAVIHTQNIAKQFEGEWIFNAISLSFSAQECYHIAGGNGSGKSTLLQLLAGFTIPSKGQIHWEFQQQNIPHLQLFQHIAWCAPYTSLFTELTLQQCFDFHAQHKKMVVENAREFAQIARLEKHLTKRLSNFSSGMLQRVKLALCLLSESNFCFLDEPCSNLDAKAMDWYQSLIEGYQKDKLLIIASNNHPQETFCCKQKIDVELYKP